MISGGLRNPSRSSRCQRSISLAELFGERRVQRWDRAHDAYLIGRVPEPGQRAGQIGIARPAAMGGHCGAASAAKLDRRRVFEGAGAAYWGGPGTFPGRLACCL